MAVETLGLGHWYYDAELDHRFWAPRVFELHGLDPSDGRITAERWLGTLHPDDREAVLASLEQEMADAAIIDREYRVLVGGEVRYLRSFARVLRDAPDAPVRLIGFNWDVTDQRVTREELFRSQRLEVVGQLAGEFAHQFNNLLMANLARAESIWRHAENPTLVRAEAEALRASVSAGRELTDRLVSLARHKPQASDVIFIDRFMPSAIRALGRMHRCDVEYDDQVGRACAVRISSASLELALRCLVENAVQAAPAEPVKITMRARQTDKGDQICVDVVDRGDGVPPELRGRAFEPFVSGWPGRAGLGLAVVWSIAERSGASVSLSQADGGGTRATLCFDHVADAIDEAPVAGDLAIDPEAWRDVLRVLVVDDTPLVRKSVAALAHAIGVEVGTAQSAAEALEAVDTGSWNVVLSDVRMPDMDGIELAEALAQRGDDRPDVVLMSGFHSSALDVLVERGVVSAVLDKPFRRAALEDALKRSRSATRSR